MNNTLSHKETFFAGCWNIPVRMQTKKQIITSDYTITSYDYTFTTYVSRIRCYDLLFLLQENGNSSRSNPYFLLIFNSIRKEVSKPAPPNNNTQAP